MINIHNCSVCIGYNMYLSSCQINLFKCHWPMCSAENYWHRRIEKYNTIIYVSDRKILTNDCFLHIHILHISVSVRKIPTNVIFCMKDWLVVYLLLDKIIELIRRRRKYYKYNGTALFTSHTLFSIGLDPNNLSNMFG